ncbi:hypothetical protein CK203_116642 [Vitis vinifera]|uniref:Uncharacterized protein n=1 Tax=Vitis vinifera TaxID=29760 RepID=A0A438CUF2_VITVI|nr:hypothetical protein CK203_116642 [Vitis vinifera]
MVDSADEEDGEGYKCGDGNDDDDDDFVDLEEELEARCGLSHSTSVTVLNSSVEGGYKGRTIEHLIDVKKKNSPEVGEMYTQDILHSKLSIDTIGNGISPPFPTQSEGVLKLADFADELESEALLKLSP